MQQLFLADLHLGEDTPEIFSYFQQFISYCRENTEEIEAIYILGDLFEVWIGDDYVEHSQSEAVKFIFSQLNWLSSQSIKTYFIHGNRDFLVGKQFEELSGFQVVSDPYLIKLDHKNILLSHGDIFCTDDQHYQQIRTMFRNPEWQKDFLSKTIPERYQMALEARQQSQNAYQERLKNSAEQIGEKEEFIEDVNQQAVEKAMLENQAEVLIHGHTHRPDMHNFELNGKQVERMVLAAWYRRGSFLKYQNGQFDLIFL